jgi:hypothetical protein
VDVIGPNVSCPTKHGTSGWQSDLIGNLDLVWSNVSENAQARGEGAELWLVEGGMGVM